MHTLDTFLPLTAFIVFQRAFIGEATLSFKEQCLKWHNDYRSIHQAPTVTWNDAIAADAEVWATYLADNNVFEHATNLGQLDQGENLYLVSVQPTEPCTDATKAFYEEIKDYNFDQPGFSSKTGHFTQVMMYRCETAFFTRKGIHSSNRSMGMCRRYRRLYGNQPGKLAPPIRPGLTVNLLW
ncbi:Golgi-associated plant pathogenesis-related protein 1-like isoform X2 [Acropora muricata]|uniref:Golgi-associated plant pathogenesis-related protein 1-like isoform X2 n=1 Tax=Acropora muricata TaxID=159855 RepID=UPI0034E3FEC8